MTTPPKPQDGEMPDTCREEFEDWFSKSDPDCPSIVKSNAGQYRLMQAHSAWQAWQACWDVRTASMVERLDKMKMPEERPTWETGDPQAWDELHKGWNAAIDAIRDSMIKEAGQK